MADSGGITIGGPGIVFCSIHGSVTTELGWCSKCSGTETTENTCWICLKPKVQPPEGCAGHYDPVPMESSEIAALRQQLAAAEAREAGLREALAEANKRFEEIHDEWAEPSESAGMGQIAAACLRASMDIDAALATPSPRAEAMLRLVKAAEAIRGWGVEFDDERLRYITVQVERSEVEEFDAALAAHREAR